MGLTNCWSHESSVLNVNLSHHSTIVSFYGPGVQIWDPSVNLLHLRHERGNGLFNFDSESVNWCNRMSQTGCDTYSMMVDNERIVSIVLLQHHTSPLRFFPFPPWSFSTKEDDRQSNLESIGGIWWVEWREDITTREFFDPIYYGFKLVVSRRETEHFEMRLTDLE